MSQREPTILVTGVNGQVGFELLRSLQALGRVVPCDRAMLDLSDLERVRAVVRDVKPALIVNPAAHTAVDKAETDIDMARRLNADVPRVLAEEAARSGAALIHYSTDYVFDGTADEPYREDAPLHPLGAYGRTKAEGERRVLEAHPSPYIVRTAWLYGHEGSSFPRTMLRLAAERDTVDVVTDQVGQPTWTMDVARLIATLVESSAPGGIYHATNGDSASWFVFARELFIRAGLDPERVRSSTSDAFVRPAQRPAYSVLGHTAWTRAGIEVPRPWRDALDDAFADGAFADLLKEGTR